MSKIIKNIRLFSNKSIKSYITNPISGKIIKPPAKITNRSITDILDNYDINYKNIIKNNLNQKHLDYILDIKKL